MHIYRERYFYLHKPLYLAPNMLAGRPGIQPRPALAIIANMLVTKAMVFLDVAIQSDTSLRLAPSGTASTSLQAIVAVAAATAHSIFAFATRSGSTTGAATSPNSAPSSRAVMLASIGVNLAKMTVASFWMAAKHLAASLALYLAIASRDLFSNGVSFCG